VEAGYSAADSGHVGSELRDEPSDPERGGDAVAVGEGDEFATAAQ